MGEENKKGSSFNKGEVIALIAVVVLVVMVAFSLNSLFISGSTDGKSYFNGYVTGANYYKDVCIATGIKPENVELKLDGDGLIFKVDNIDIIGKYAISFLDVKMSFETIVDKSDLDKALKIMKALGAKNMIDGVIITGDKPFSLEKEIEGVIYNFDVKEINGKISIVYTGYKQKFGF